MVNKPSNWNKMSAEDRALWEYINAGSEFSEGGAPVFAAGDELQYQQLDPYQLAQLQESEYNNIGTNPELANAEFDALRQLEEQSEKGMTAREEAELAKVRSQNNRIQRGRTDAIKSNMAARGMSGSGMDMLAQMKSQQDLADREALSALEQNAQKLERRTSATAQKGQMAGNMRAQQFSEEARKAEARDTINRFNTQSRLNAQLQNNQLANNASMQNWGRQNQTSDRNTQAGYDFRRDKMGVQQNNAQFSYNKSADDWNRAQMIKQQKKAKQSGIGSAVGGVVGGVAGAYFGGPAGAAAGYQVGSGLGGNFAYGGRVPGEAPFPGDDEMNDIFNAQLSPGEVVVPRTLADDPKAAAQYVASVNEGLDPMAAKYIAQNEKQKVAERVPFYPTPDGKPIPKVTPSVATNRPRVTAKPSAPSAPSAPNSSSREPALDPRVAEYMRKKIEAEKGVKDAQRMQDYMGLANYAGKGFTDFANSQKKDVILKNRMQDLGGRPDVIEAKRTQYDGSMLDKLSEREMARAKDAEGKVFKDFQEGSQVQVYGDAQKLKDPNSMESQSAREYLKALIPGAANNPSFDSMSAEQLNRVAPMIMEKWKAEREDKRYAQDVALRRELASMKVGRSGKPLPADTAAKFSGYDSADKILDDLSVSWNENTGFFSGVTQALPNTDAKRYNSEARKAAQAIGTALEGGKLTDADYDKYLDFLPTPGDSRETKEKKIQDLKRMLRDKREAEASLLQESGYGVSTRGESASKQASGKKYDWE